MFAVGSDIHIELGNLVSILAWSGHLDGSSPVEVEMTKRVSQLLNVNLGQGRVVLWHEEMGRQNATLVGRCWGHVEIELLIIARTVALDEASINDTSGRRVE